MGDYYTRYHDDDDDKPYARYKPKDENKYTQNTCALTFCNVNSSKSPVAKNIAGEWVRFCDKHADDWFLAHQIVQHRDNVKNNVYWDIRSQEPLIIKFIRRWEKYYLKYQK